ncbi:glycosyltransferase family 2 protein [Nonomuraea sp. NPDC048826]|uniref:glycosyltransferase family 2 protein n=1 Tax=Nonomuraea sp. NPDC048826 TaxID=3364347 RepID=UPI00371DE18B
MTRPYVTVVVVSHDGARWLGETLRGLLGQSRRPDRVIGVDNGSRDGSADLLAQALGPGNVRKLPRSASFGEAVADALRAAPAVGENEWIWLLHDDCAADRRALEALLHAADQDRKATVLGPKLRDWIDRRRLLEIGVTVGLTGRRDTGLEPREFDQGQHDGTREVLSVSTAGMLIRRDVWEAAGGLDPFFPLFRDDLDLCWRVRNAGHRVLVVTDAVAWHAEAAARRRRRITVSGDHPRRLDRRNAIFVVMANLPFRTLLWALVRNVVGSFVRTLLFLVGKQPANALDELVAFGSILVHPLRLLRARRARRAGRKKGFARVRPLLTPRGAGLRRLVDMTRGFLSGDRPVESAGRHHHAAPENPEEPEELPEDRGAVKRFLGRPGVLLVLALTLVTLVAERSLLGGARLGGGALVPVTGDAAGLWAFYTDGSSGWAPPYTAVVAALSTLAFGQTWAVVSVLLLGSVPLAGASAYLATRRLPMLSARRPARGGRSPSDVAPAQDLFSPGSASPVEPGPREKGRRRRAGRRGRGSAVPATSASTTTSRSTVDGAGVSGVSEGAGPAGVGVAVRVWIAATYALLPVATGAVAAGRLGTAVVFVLLPAYAVLGGHLLFGDHRRSRRAAWGLGLLLAVGTAFVPLVYALAAVLGLAAAWLLRGRRPGVVISTGIALAVPVVLLLPWLVDLASAPGRFLLEAGLHGPELSDARLAPEFLLALNPGGPGAPPFWVTGGLVAAGLAALVVRGRRRAVAAGWAVALFGVLVALVVARVEVSGAPAWPGVPLALAAAALLVLAGLSAGSFASLRAAGGPRRMAAGLVAVVAFGTPLLAAGLWIVQGVRGPLRSDAPDPLPALAAVHSRDGGRTLLIRGSEFTVLRGRAPLLGEADVPVTSEARVRIRAAAEGLAGGRGGTDAATLAQNGVAMVAVAAPVPPALAETLDSQPSLQRMSLSDAGGLWRVAEPVTPAQPPPAHFLYVPWLWAQGALVLAVVVLAAPGRREPVEEPEPLQRTPALAGAR